jgi:hypothetical protein
MGRDGVYAVLKELKDVGYLHTIGNRNDGGTFAGADYLVTESPYTAFPDTVGSPDTALPDTVEPDTANPTQVSIDLKQGLIGKQGLKGESASAPHLDIPDDLLNDWIAVRKAKRAGALTKTAIAGLQREADKAGISLIDAVTACCEFGWQGFNAQWYADRTTNRPAAAMTASNRQPESFAERDARNTREAWERMTGRQWPADELPGAKPAAPFTIDIESTEIKRLSK